MTDRRESLLAVLLVSSALAGCEQKDDGWDTGKPTRYCVDAQGHRVPDLDCRTPTSGGTHPFLWYYLGTLNGGRTYYVPPIGGGASGGSYSPLAGTSYFSAPTSEGVSSPGFSPAARGGFGSIGAGGGEGGGAGE